MSDAFYDVTFVGPVTLGRDKVASERTIEDHSDCASGQGYGCAKWGVRRVTYSFEIKFDETDDQHFWRVMDAQVVKEIKAGRTARRVAELGEWEPMTARERAQRSDPHGPDSRAREQHGDFKIRWTKLYLAATAKRPDLARLHEDARRYLDELEGRSPPGPKPVINWPSVDDPAQRKALEQWLEAK